MNKFFFLVGFIKFNRIFDEDFEFNYGFEDESIIISDGVFFFCDSFMSEVFSFFIIFLVLDIFVFFKFFVLGIFLIIFIIGTTLINVIGISGFSVLILFVKLFFITI